MEECETSLRAFVRASWAIIEPGVPYIHGMHIDAICEHLEAVSNGEIRQLIINMPPRHGKSTVLAVLWPAWVWITNPAKKWLYASYAENLSIRDSRKCRNLIRSPWYQKHWSGKFKIVTDQNEKRRFDNDKMGYRLATSVNGSNTGEGGDLIVYDDPNNVNEVDSDTIREGVNDWHDQTMTTRLNDPKTGARVVVQQRSHERDMTGHLLEKGGWDLLMLPAEYEGPTKATSIGWVDPRSKFGELLAPERFGPTEIETLKRDLGATGAAGQLQQRPSPGEGGKFKRQYWNYWNPVGTDTRPVQVKNPGQQAIDKTPIPIPIAFEQIVQSWDCTFKDEKDNDFVAGHVWGRIGANVYLIARKSERMDFPKTLKAVRAMSKEFPCPEKLVEDKANGPAVIATLRNEIPGLIAINPEGGKVARANAVAPYAEAGNVFLPNPDLFPWVRDFVEQCANFPRGRHDDDVDAMTQALRRLYDALSNTSVPEFRVLPRVGEPETACHVEQDAQMRAALPPHWRRWISVSPGSTGAALWICETPKGSLRIYREMELGGLDAHEAGRQIAAATLPDIRAFMSAVHSTARWNIDVLLEKEAFTPIEPIGSYAELLEQGLLSYDPTEGSWDDRQIAKSEFRQAKFSSQMADVENAAFDRLRELLRFQPADFEELPYDRAKALALAKRDINLYNSYMAAVEGRVEGEFPKVKFAASCVQTVASLGAARREDDIEDPFLRALLVGISAPPSVMTQKPIKEVPWPAAQRRPATRFRRAG